MSARRIIGTAICCKKNYVKEIPKVEFIGLPIGIRILTRTSTSLVPSPTPGFSSLAVR